MERGNAVGTDVAEIDTNGFTHFGFQNVGTHQGALTAIEHHIRRMLGQPFSDIKRRHTFCIRLASEKLAFHHVKLAVHLSQAAFRLHQNQAVHAVGDVIDDRSRRAMINKQTRYLSLEGEHLRLSGGNGVNRRAAARTIHRMNINIVWLGVGLRIAQVKLHRIAHPDPRHRTRHRPIKTPVIVFDAVGNLTQIFLGFKMKDDRLVVRSRNRWRYVRCRRQLRPLL